MSVDIGSFITCTPGIVGGRPRIAGTRMPVQTIAIFYKRGESPEEIGLQYPHLSMAQIYAALTYYHANQAEMEAAIAEEAKLYDRLAREDWEAKQAAKRAAAREAAEKVSDAYEAVL
jgi:uncharacterized protein (DUF433 family)